MANTAKLALGTVLKRGDGGGTEVFTQVPYMISTPKIGQKNPLVKVTYSDATAEEYIAGIPDGMELPFAFNYDSANAQHAGLITDVTSKLNRNFQVTVPAASTKTLSFTITCLEYSFETTFDKQIILHFVGKVSGSITIT